jgi:branched-chain amino acid transport system permease protein
MLTLQLLINGVALGAAYALCALGFVLILNATGAVNFAQGDMVVAGGYAAIALASFLPVTGVFLLPAVVLLTGLFSAEIAAADRRVHQHDRGRNRSAEQRGARLRA